MTAIEYPPMQRGPSFNLDAVKAKIEALIVAGGPAWGRPPARWRAGQCEDVDEAREAHQGGPQLV